MCPVDYVDVIKPNGDRVTELHFEADDPLEILTEPRLCPWCIHDSLSQTYYDNYLLTWGFHYEEPLIRLRYVSRRENDNLCVVCEVSLDDPMFDD